MPTRKFNFGDRVEGNDRKGSFWGRKGIVVAYEARGQYWVKFNDGSTECVDTGWLNHASHLNPSTFFASLALPDTCPELAVP